MPVINDIVQELVAWLGTKSLHPQPREITSVGLLPASAYPQLAVLVEDEVFSPGDTEATAILNLRVAYAGGRPADAMASCRDLAHQVRTAINGSHGLGGTAKRLRALAIRYGELKRNGEQAVVATAVVEIAAKYCVSPLT